MKHNKISIKWKIFLYMVAFTLFLLGLVWFFQIAQLSGFYKKIKKQELKNAANKVIEAFNADDVSESMYKISNEYDVAINITDSVGLSIFSVHVFESSHIYIFNSAQFMNLYNKAKSAGGTVMYEVVGRYRDDKPSSELQRPMREPSSFWNMRHNEMKNDTSMIYLRIITSEDGNEYMVMLSSLITPVDATVATLRIQFGYISLIFIVLALIMALLLSRRISRPIVGINESAKRLATGDFQTEFSGKGYKEVEELAKTLNYASTELGRSERLQKELVANVSHDLRTPLTMITAYSEVMRDLPGENTPENAQVIIDETKRLTMLVNDILDLSKLQAGATELKTERFNFTTSVLAVMKRFSKLTEQQGYNIIFEYREEVYVEADEFKVHQVLYNLINNAINYSGEDKQVIVKQIVHGKTVRIEIIDHGNGIGPEELCNIWDRYYKVDKTHKRAFLGSGIGLSIVKNILKLHNAKYGVNSVLGKGSTFWFELNIADVTAID